MSRPSQPSTPAERERAQARLRTLTRGAIVAATGATVAIGVVVAHDRPGAGAARQRRQRPTAGSVVLHVERHTDAARLGNDRQHRHDTPATPATTGNTGASSVLEPRRSSSSSPTVTSGGTSR